MLFKKNPASPIGLLSMKGTKGHNTHGGLSSTARQMLSCSAGMMLDP